MKHLFVLLGLWCSMACTPLAAQSATVGQWDRFEMAVENGKSYENPYSDVTLEVSWTAPDGRVTDFWGFYDGGKTWRIRWMPDQLGEWQYKSQFSDGTPGLSGSVTCVASDIPGMIARDEDNPLWFGYKGDKHELIRGLHIGDRFFAENWDVNERRKFLDWVGLQRYNLLSVASHFLNRDSEGRGRGWQTPDLWPLNAAEFQKMEHIYNDLAKRKIIVYPFAGIYGKSSDFPTDHGEQELYARYMIARLGPYWNVLWNVAGPEPNLPGTRDEFQFAMEKEDVRRLGALIGELDPFGHLVSVHNATGDDPHKDDAWETYGTLQGPKTTNHATLSKGLLRNHHQEKPLLAQETLWGGNKYHPQYSLTAIRKNAYVLNFSAAAIVFGDMQGNSSTGFSGTLDLSERVQARHDVMHRIWDFMESVPFHRMRPRQDLVSDGFCLADAGAEYLVYLPNGGRVSVDIAGGPYDVTWIDAQNTYLRVGGGVTEKADRLLAPSTGDDWVLHLTQ